MAAGQFTAFKQAKKGLGAAGINLSSGVLRMGLLKAAAALSAGLDVSVWTSINGNELADGNGYSTSGKSVAAKVWTLSGNNVKLDGTLVQWDAAGGSLTSIMYAVLWLSGGKLLGFSQLSSAAFGVPTGSSLKVTPATAGYFVLS